MTKNTTYKCRIISELSLRLNLFISDKVFNFLYMVIRVFNIRVLLDSLSIDKKVAHHVRGIMKFRISIFVIPSYNIYLRNFYIKK